MSKKESPSTAEIHAFAASVAGLMGRWAYLKESSKNADGELHWSATIGSLADDARVSLSHVVKNGEHRIVARTDVPWTLPDKSRFSEPYGFDRASVTFAWGRPALAVANRIMRDVVPNARALMGHYQARATERASDAERQRLAVETLRPFGKVHTQNWSDDLCAAVSFAFPGDPYARAQVSHGKVKIELTSLTPEQAVAVIQALQSVELAQAAE